MIKIFFPIFFFSSAFFAVCATPELTPEQRLHQKVEEIAQPLAMRKTEVIPGIQIDFQYWDVPLQKLREKSLKILEERYALILEDPRYFLRRNTFFGKIGNFFAGFFQRFKEVKVESDLFFYMPLLYWENKNFDKAMGALSWLENQGAGDPGDLLSDLWTHLSFYFAKSKNPPARLIAKARKLMEDPWQATEIRNKITKLSSFYGISCDLYQMKTNFDYVMHSLKELMGKDPNLVFLMRRDRSLFHFPDIVKSVMQGMKRPAFWAKNKVEQAFFLLSDLEEYQEILSESGMKRVIQNPALPSFVLAIKEKSDCLQLLPYEQSLLSQSAMLEQKITPAVLQEIAETGKVKELPEAVRYNDFLDLVFLYKNSEVKHWRHAFQIVTFVQNHFFQSDPRVALYLAVMNLSGVGTAQDKGQAKVYFLQALYRSVKPDEPERILKRNLSILSTFAYWFNVKLPYDPDKTQMTPDYAFQIFAALARKGRAVENAFLQAYVSDSDYCFWDLLQKAFQAVQEEEEDEEEEEIEEIVAYCRDLNKNK